MVIPDKDFYRECGVAFLLATKEMLLAAKDLMPFPDVRENEKVEEYRDRVSPEEFINYTLFHEIKDIVANRVTPHDLLKLTAIEMADDHFEKNQGMYARHKWNRGVTQVFVHAAALSHVAYDITAVLGSGNPEIGSDEKRADLSWNFLAIAKQCAVVRGGDVMQRSPELYLQHPIYVAWGVKHGIKPIAA